MRFFSVAKDGGPESPVTGFYLIEIKWLFSIVFLKFNPGSRKNYHSHAFNALTWFIKGIVTEFIHHSIINDREWQASFKPKFTPRSCFHKIHCDKPAYAVSLRGPWSKTWEEYNPTNKESITLTHGRKVVNRSYPDEC